VDDNVAIKVDHVSKKYCKSLKWSMLYGVKDIAGNMLGLSSHSERLRKNEFWAVDDVSFEAKNRETLGIIGPNGSGKSTLLKMLNGIFWPDKGKITVRGRVGALIEVGAGFHPLLSGRENIYINAAILGMTRDEVDEKFDEIIEFADIGDFIDAPVKFYSSGMFVRLGFAVAIHCVPSIMLIDEVLAVGDVDFQSRCFNKLGELRKNGVTNVLVSHSMMHILGFCDKVLYINGGKIKYYGAADKAIEMYQQDTISRKNLPSIQFGDDDISGSGRVRFTRIEFLDENETPTSEVNAQDSLTLRAYYAACEDIGSIELDVAIAGCGGDIFFRASSKAHGKRLIMHKGNGFVDVTFESLRANNQTLLFYVCLWTSDRSEVLDWKRELPLGVVGDSRCGGKCLLNIDWTNHQ
jgi:lipopolysaccharide transport system ATP-binding protein